MFLIFRLLGRLYEELMKENSFDGLWMRLIVDRDDGYLVDWWEIMLRNAWSRTG